jgi:hypothetical protein
VPKLTLSVDEEVIGRAKEFAARRGTSVSKLVEEYLDRLTARETRVSEAPVLGRLRGIAAGADPATYRRHLERKYR